MYLRTRRLPPPTPLAKAVASALQAGRGRATDLCRFCGTSSLGLSEELNRPHVASPLRPTETEMFCVSMLLPG